MRLARVRYDDGRWLARLEDDDAVLLLEEDSHPAADALREALVGGVDLAADGKRVALDQTRLLAPVANPSKILAIGLNYADHARESGMQAPPGPVMFVKTPNAIVGPGDAIVYRRADSGQVDYEVELAAVIGRRARDVGEADALDCVLGYTIGNDVSARDAQFADAQWVRGKSFDTFAPLGPWLVTADEIGDLDDLGVRARVNGRLLQDGSSREMIFGVAELVAYLSRFLTLVPGDVILTGTPHGVGFARTPPVYLGDGDVVEVEVDRIGTLSNPVRVLD